MIGTAKFHTENLVKGFLHELCTGLSTNIVDNPKSHSARMCYATLLSKSVKDSLQKFAENPNGITFYINEFAGGR